MRDGDSPNSMKYDDKIIAVPSEDVDRRYNHIRDINDISDLEKSRIIYFFSTYDDNPNKFYKVDRIGNRDEAYRVINNCIKNYQKLRK